jgi:hypothetical protein
MCAPGANVIRRIAAWGRNLDFEDIACDYIAQGRVQGKVKHI